MAWTTVPAAGAKLRGGILSDLFTEVRPKSARKASDTARNTTATRTADPDLTLTLPAGTWEGTAVMIVSSAANAAGDFSWELAWTGTATVTMSGWALDGSITDLTSATINAGAATTVDTTSPTGNQNAGCTLYKCVAVTYFTIALTTAGSVTLNWAQEASNGNNTTLHAGSSIRVQRLES